MYIYIYIYIYIGDCAVIILLLWVSLITMISRQRMKSVFGQKKFIYHYNYNRDYMSVSNQKYITANVTISLVIDITFSMILFLFNS